MKKMYCIVLCIFLFYCIGYGQKLIVPSFRVFSGYPEFINIEGGILWNIMNEPVSFPWKAWAGLGTAYHTIYTKVNTGYDGNLMHYRGVVGYSPLSGFITAQLGTGIDLTKQSKDILLEVQIGVSILKIKYQIVGFRDNYIFIGIGLF